MSPCKSTESDTEGDISLTSEPSDTFSTKVNNGSAASLSEISPEEDSAGVGSSAETLAAMDSSIPSHRTMHTEAAERATRLERMLEEDSPWLFGNGRNLQRHLDQNQLPFNPENGLEVKAKYFPGISKSDELELESYCTSTHLIVFPVRKRVSGGENNPWRLTDGREATQPPRRNLHTSSRNTTHALVAGPPTPSSIVQINYTNQNTIRASSQQITTANGSGTSTYQLLHTNSNPSQFNTMANHSSNLPIILPLLPEEPSTIPTITQDPVCSSQNGGSNNTPRSARHEIGRPSQPILAQQPSTADFYWQYQGQLHPSTIYHPPGCYCCEMPRLNANLHIRPVSSSHCIYDSTVADGRALDHPYSSDPAQGTGPRPPPNDPNTRGVAQAGTTSFLQQSTEHMVQPENSFPINNVVDDTGIHHDSDNMTSDSHYTHSPDTRFFQTPSLAQFYSSGPSTIQQNSSSDTHDPQNGIISPPINEADPNGAETEQSLDFNEYIDML